MGAELRAWSIASGDHSNTFNAGTQGIKLYIVCMCYVASFDGHMIVT